jgi:hypothetical protein
MFTEIVLSEGRVYLEKRPSLSASHLNHLASTDVAYFFGG